MHPHTSASAYHSDRSRLTGLAEALLDPSFVLLGPPLHLLDLRPGRTWMDVVLKHVSDSFKPRLGQLVDESFEFVASGHDGERMPRPRRMIKDITITKDNTYRDWTKRIPESLSNWRSRLGLTSMLVLSADWCSIIFLVLADKANLGWARSIESWFSYLIVAPIVAALLALALKGRARTCAFAASLSMASHWATS